MLNYAEAKAELGQFDATEWAKTIAPLRERAGVNPVIPASADQYMVDYFNGSVTDKWILEIRRERGIEFCLEMGLRWDDLMRWKMGNLLNSAENPWTGIYIPSTSQEYDFNGDGKIDLKLVSKESEASATAVFLASAESNQSFTLNSDNNIQWNYQRAWAEYKYLRPIPTDAITRNPNLEQNVLWVGK